MPIVEFAIAVTEHLPLSSVVQVEGEKVAPAPDVRIAKLTMLPDTGLLALSATRTCKAAEKLRPIVALWPPPENAVSEAAGPGVLAVPPVVVLPPVVVVVPLPDVVVVPVVVVLPLPDVAPVPVVVVVLLPLVPVPVPVVVVPLPLAVVPVVLVGLPVALVPAEVALETSDGLELQPAKLISSRVRAREVRRPGNCTENSSGPGIVSCRKLRHANRSHA